MTQDEIIRMAREAGFIHTPPTLNVERELWENLERFAALVVAHVRNLDENKPTYFIPSKPIEAAVLAEREACAKVCYEKFDEFSESKDDWFNGFANGSYECAAAIRARGDK